MSNNEDKSAPRPWKLVPLMPTPAMLQAVGTIRGFDDDRPDADRCHVEWWRDMVDAAPAPPDEPAFVADLRESDRIAGEAIRKLGWLEESARKRDQWLRQAKAEAGYDNNTSFDDVWAEALTALKEKRTAVNSHDALLECVEALKECIEVLESAEMQGVFTMLHIHGMQYLGPRVDMIKAKAALLKLEKANG